MIETITLSCCGLYFILGIAAGIKPVIEWMIGWGQSSGRQPIPHWMRSAVATRDGRFCAYCGKYISGVYHLDHIIPVAQGGLNTPGNLTVACPQCNLRKGARTPRQAGLRTPWRI